MDEAGLSFGARRRNTGWLYILDEDFQLIGSPPAIEALPDDVEPLVRAVATQWSKQAWRGELLAMLTPRLSARVFPLEGPGGGCVCVYIELIYTRVKS